VIEKEGVSTKILAIEKEAPGVTNEKPSQVLVHFPGVGQPGSVFGNSCRAIMGTPVNGTGCDNGLPGQRQAERHIDAHAPADGHTHPYPSTDGHVITNPHPEADGYANPGPSANRHLHALTGRRAR
jgi:hypothetical protein